MNRPPQSLEQIFDAQIRVLATTLCPSTVAHYQCVARRFLAYLHDAFPRLHQPAQLRRNPHLLGWFRWLAEQSLSNQTRSNYLLRLRRLLHDSTDNGHAFQPGLIRLEDFPPLPHYLPKPLSPEDDRQLDLELRHTDNLAANALLLIRATGIRIGECVDLSLDCLRQLNENQWALHVPLGKLHTERWVPVDDDVRSVVARILALRPLSPLSCWENSRGFLLPRRGCGKQACQAVLRHVLADAARRAGCTTPVTPHRLRHSFATTMLRLGVSLPALMQLLGHKDITMTLRYLEVTQQDLQREFHLARQNIVHLHSIPKLPLPSTTPLRADPSTIRNAIAATRHLLEMFRLQLQDDTTRRKLRRLIQRLLNISCEVDHLTAK